jgi:hypothetical protein
MNYSLICVTKSTNTNSFGLKSFIFVGQDGKMFKGLGNNLIDRTIDQGYKITLNVKEITDENLKTAWADRAVSIGLECSEFGPLNAEQRKLGERVFDKLNSQKAA